METPTKTKCLNNTCCIVCIENHKGENLFINEFKSDWKFFLWWVSVSSIRIWHAKYFSSERKKYMYKIKKMLFFVFLLQFCNALKVFTLMWMDESWLQKSIVGQGHVAKEFGHNFFSLVYSLILKFCVNILTHLHRCYFFDKVTFWLYVYTILS